MTQISLITATYNAAVTLDHCLQSVASQTVTPEHLIIDGCSTDETLMVAGNHSGHLLQVVSEPDNGIYDAMNKGIQKANGDVVGILNADDFYASPEVLEDVTKAFQDPSVDACYGDLCYVNYDDTAKIVRYWQADGFDNRKFYWGWMPPHPTFFVRKAAYERFGAFNLDLGTAADYELMLRFLVRHHLHAVYIPKVLVKMRTGGVSNAALKNRLRANRMDRKAWLVNELRPYPWTLTMKPLRKIGQWFSKAPDSGSSPG
ncbi:glycosyltransferase family 2 protein [Desulfocastanea catecholica]